MVKANAVFQGGGMRGIGIIGAISYLESKGYTWKNTAGSSVGAVIAALVTAGYSARQMKKIITETNFNNFLIRDGLQKVPIVGTALGVLKQKGIYSGDYVEKWVENLLKFKGIYSFKDIMINGKSPLKIIASDITRKKMMVLPDDLQYYGINASDFKIAEAVRMSASIPFYFKPVEFISGENKSYVVDGGVTCDFPIEIFDTEFDTVLPTIGFKFEEKIEPSIQSKKSNALSFFFDIADTMVLNKKDEWHKDKNKSRTIVIPTEDVNSTDFSISREKSMSLYKSGFKSAIRFLRNWNYEDYVKKYCSNDFTP